MIIPKSSNPKNKQNLKSFFKCTTSRSWTGHCWLLRQDTNTEITYLNVTKRLIKIFDLMKKFFYMNQTYMVRKRISCEEQIRLKPEMRLSLKLGRFISHSDQC